jgi:hypothetical protein
MKSPSISRWTVSGWIAPTLFGLCVACASTPRPQALTSLDTLAASPRGVEAKQLAPQAFHHSRQLAAEAQRAHDAGDPELAALLAEQSQVTLEQAFVLARAAKADTRRTTAQRAVDASTANLAAVDAQQAALLAQTEAVELRTRVIRDALPLSTSGKAASPEREQARREAARALVGDARLLCVAAQLLQGDAEKVRKQLEAVATLEREIEQSWRTVPIDAASKARSECLSLLSAARRSNAASTAAPGNAASPAVAPMQPVGAAMQPVDMLLDELSRAGQQPQRDDRGVVVTLRNGFENNHLAAAAQKRLTELARVANAHAQYPVLLVLHQARGKPTAADTEKLNSARQALQSAGVSAVQAELAGSNQPLVPTSHPRAASENARLEVVFVAPIW